MLVTQAEFRRVKAYVKTLRDAMQLSQWEIRVDVLALEVSNAKIYPTDGQHHALLDIHENIIGDPEVLRESLVHEMIHLYHHHATDIIRRALPKELSNSAYVVLWEAFRQQTEIMTDDLARLIAPHMPLP